MIDPQISLAFAIYSNKGAYALLLGSGLSRSAGIPTGWEIVLDLIRQVARLADEDCGADPESWYQKKYGKEPDYGTLLAAIAKSPTERQQLLRRYFEPTVDEAAEGLKVPRDAHRAIARLVQAGYIRTIITTNFDRLIERALDDIGIAPTVIGTSDQAKGALPIAHSPCTLLKVHGDYLDTRIRNSPEELVRYEKSIDRLLDRIFDEYGLLVCGWSAEWDPALRAALERCPTHRFTSFWVHRGHLSSEAEQLIQLRRSIAIHSKDADYFFTDIAEKVASLEEFSKPHPLSAKVAVAMAKRYLADGKERIRLHDLIVDEIERTYSRIANPELLTAPDRVTSDALGKRLGAYDSIVQILRALVATGCYWGNDAHEYLWKMCLERLGRPPGERSGGVAWLDFRRYPAFALMYAGGMAAFSAGKFSTLATLLVKTKIFDNYKGHDAPAVAVLAVDIVLDRRWAKMLPGRIGHRSPLSDHLFEELRPDLAGYAIGEDEYANQFDRFEYFLALVYADLRPDDDWLPTGRFIWRAWTDHAAMNVRQTIHQEAEEASKDWAPFRAGFFEGNPDRLARAEEKILNFVHRYPRF